MADSSPPKLAWRTAGVHEHVLHVSCVRDLRGLASKREITALCIEQSSLADMSELELLPALRELHLIGCELPSLDVLPRLGQLQRVSIVGSVAHEVEPILQCASLRECVLRAVPWSSRSWTYDVPRVQTRADLVANVADTAQWTTCVDAHLLFGVCAEPLGDDETVIVLQGARADGGVYRTERKPVREAITRGGDRESLVRLAASGAPFPEWAYDLAAMRLVVVEPQAILESIARSGLDPVSADALGRYVRRFPTLRHRPRTTQSAALASCRAPIPRALGVLVDVVGEWDVIGPPEVRVRGDGSWWAWHPRGAWEPCDHIAQGPSLFPVALDAALERALWIQVGPGEQTSVWTGDIGSHEPGAEIDPHALSRIADSLADLLDRVEGVRLRDGTEIPAQETD